MDDTECIDRHLPTLVLDKMLSDVPPLIHTLKEVHLKDGTFSMRENVYSLLGKGNSKFLHLNIFMLLTADTVSKNKGDGDKHDVS